MHLRADHLVIPLFVSVLNCLLSPQAVHNVHANTHVLFTANSKQHTDFFELLHTMAAANVYFYSAVPPVGIFIEHGLQSASLRFLSWIVENVYIAVRALHLVLFCLFLGMASYTRLRYVVLTCIVCWWCFKQLIMEIFKSIRQHYMTTT